MIMAGLRERLQGLWAKQTMSGKMAALTVVVVVLTLVISRSGSKSSMGKDVKTGSVHPAVESAVKSASETGGGVFLDREIERKEFVARLEKQYDRSTRRTSELEGLVNGIDARIYALSVGQQKLQGELDALVRETAARPVIAEEQNGRFEPSAYRLDVVTVAEADRKDADEVFLPAGSFVSGTLLSGVTAPVLTGSGGVAGAAGQGLPVLIRLNKAFTGPNGSSVPLQGAFALGLAVGDVNSQRARISVQRLSAVLSGGRSFEKAGDLGFVIDGQGDYGIRGQLIRNTGRQVAASFMTGFMGGAAQTVADSETTATERDGRSTRYVSGDPSRHAVFSGLGQSAVQLSKYYQDRLDEIIAAVIVPSGAQVYVVIKEGIVVHGLKADIYRSFVPLD